MRMVLVEWVDSSFSDHGWEDIDTVLSVDRCAMMKTAGFLLYEGDNCVRIGLSYSEKDEELRHTEQYCSYMTIPKVCITRMVDLCDPDTNSAP
jgi:hypothetical protein